MLVHQMRVAVVEERVAQDDVDPLRRRHAERVQPSAPKKKHKEAVKETMHRWLETVDTLIP